MEPLKFLSWFTGNRKMVFGLSAGTASFTTDYPPCSTNNYTYRGVSLHLLRVAVRPQR